MAHRKLREKSCASKTNHQPCAKQCPNTQLMRILISHVFTQDTTTRKHTATGKTQAACHTEQDITWMYASNKTRTACNTHGQKSVQPSELETARSRNEPEHGARVSEPRHETRNSRHECREPNTTLQHETRHTDERVHGSSTLPWKQDMTGESGLCHKPMNNTRPKWQNPDTLWANNLNWPWGELAVICWFN